MSYPIEQAIQAGSSQLLIGTTPTEAAAVVTSLVNDAAGYTAIAQDIIVDAAATLCPNVVNTTGGTVPLADPPVCDVIVCTRTGEVMIVTSIDTAVSETIHAIRGVSLHWRKFAYSATQYNAALVDDDELQYLGTFTMPTRGANIVITNGDVAITATQGTFRTRDNLKGYETSYTSEPANAEVTCTLPHNTLPDTLRALGIQGVTDGNSAAKYMSQFGRMAAGAVLPKVFLVVVPNSALMDPQSVTIGTTDYWDFSKAIICPLAQPSIEWSQTYSEGSQIELPLTFSVSFDNVFQSAINYGAFDAMMEIAEVI